MLQTCEAHVPLPAHVGETLWEYLRKNAFGKECLAQMGAAIYIPVPDCGDTGFKPSSDKNAHVAQYLPKINN